MRDNLHTFANTRRSMERQAWANRVTPMVIEVLGEPLTVRDDLKAFGVICGIVGVFVALSYVALKLAA